MTKVAPLSKKTGDVEAQYLHTYNSIVNEKSPSERFNVLRSSGVPIAAKRKIKSAIDYVVDTTQQNECRLKCLKCKSAMYEGWTKFQIWRNSFKQLEGMYGSGVLSFFVFLKSLFILNIILTVIVGLFLILPQATNFGDAYYLNMLSSLNSTSSTAAKIAASCSISYYNNVTKAVSSAQLATQVQDFIQGTGWMENSILFLGYYFPQSIAVGPTYYDMPVAYLIVLGTVFFLSLIFMLNRTGAAFKEAILQDVSSNNAHKFSIAVFTGWDHGLMEENNVILYQKMMANNFIAELGEIQLQEKRRNMTCGNKCCLYLKRILINILILGMLGGAGYLIYYVQGVSADFTTKNTSELGFIYLVYQYLPSITVSAVSAILPIFFNILVGFEDYRPESALILTLLRTIFLRLAALAVLIASIYNIVRCETKDSCDVGTGVCNSLWCWETYVGQAFYKLELTFFIILIVVCFFVEFPRALIGKRCSCTLAKFIGPVEIDIPDSVLQVMYSQVLVWFGFYFCPFLPIMNMIVLFIFFYLKKFACYFSYKPPERPFKSSRATMFFMITLFLAYFLCVIPVGYIISSIKTSNTCSPYRVKEYAYTTIPDLISTWSKTSQMFIQFLGSPGFLYFVLVVLIIVIYYFRTLASARGDINKLQQSRINDEGQKKMSIAQKYSKDTGKQIQSYDKKDQNNTLPEPESKKKS